MANNSTKYISLNRLTDFLANLKETFADKIHTHGVSDLTDYVVDAELSSDSTNPVQNKTINDEFVAVSESFSAVTDVLETMSEAIENHNHDDVYYTETELDERLSNIINEVKTDSSYKDVVVLSEAQKGIDNALSSAQEYTDTVASGKANTLHNHTVTDITDLTVTATELNHMNGATSNVQVQIDTLDEDKVAYTDSPVFAADDSVDTTLEVINADTLGGMTPEYFATAEMVNNLTYSDVDAAPAGYGLGETTPRYASDLNAAITDGWYYTNTNTANVPQNRFDYSSVLVLARTSTQIAQLLTSISSSVQMMRYTQDGGATWVEEWVNPPMSFGVEYRTTERHNGKPVYTKLVNVGSLTNAGKIKVSVSNSFKIIRCNGYCKAGAGYNVTLPYKVDNSEISCAAVSNDIYLYTNFDCSSYTGYVTIWYTRIKEV